MFGPFSTLLTAPAARVAARYGYAFVEGAGGAPAVFGEGLHNVFDVSVPVKLNLVTFAQWVASLPSSQRPKTAAYATVDDPFTQPQIPAAQKHPPGRRCQDRLLQGVPGGGRPTTRRSPARSPRRTPTRSCSARSTCRPFPRSFTPSSSSTTTRRCSSRPPDPDQGATFVKAVGPGNENGIFVPNGWYRRLPEGRQPGRWSRSTSPSTAARRRTSTPTSPRRTRSARCWPRPSQPTHSFDNSKIIAYLHSGVTLNSVQGPVKFDSLGREHRPEDADVPVAERDARADASRRRRAGSKPPTVPEAQLEGVSAGRVVAQRCCRRSSTGS